MLLNGSPTKAHKILLDSSSLSYLIERPPEPPVNTCIETLYEDNEVLIVNKPGDLPVHPAGSYFHGTLVSILKKQLATDYLALIQRLDRETSGAMVLCKSRPAARKYNALLRSNCFKKSYLVAVEGLFPSSLAAHGWQRKSNYPGIYTLYEFSYEKKEESDLKSLTNFSLVASNQEQNISLVRAEIITGRHHQIRCTLKSLGYPVLGDKLYGVDPALFLKFLSDELTKTDIDQLKAARTLLHSHKLTVIDGSESRTFEAPPPSDILDLFPVPL